MHRLLLLLGLVAACATPTTTSSPTPIAATSTSPPVPVLPPARQQQRPTTPNAPPTHPVTLLRGARVMTAAGDVFERGFVLVQGGRIIAVGAGDGTAPRGAVIVDVSGKTITPGLIDTHSHMGVYPTPETNGGADGNEVGAPRTPEVESEHGFWPQDASLPQALAHGVTTIQVLPGSANLIGGRSTTFKLGQVGLASSTSARALRFPGAPQGVKFACGQNPKAVYGGEKGGRPSTRMGNVASLREAFILASDYRRKQQRYERDLSAWKQRQFAPVVTPPAEPGTPPPQPDDPPEPPLRDLGLETLVGVLDGSILLHNHCYRADEMNAVLDVAAEFGFKVRSFHHAVEAYKIAPRLAAEGVSVSTWVDWWGFKMESFDSVRENAAMVHAAGARAIIHSDSNVEIRQLNLEAAKALAAGRRLGLTISDNDALRWITANAAWAVGVDEQTGTLEPGKMADLVVWSGSPFSTYSTVEQVYVDGVSVLDPVTHLAVPTDVGIGTGTATITPASNATSTKEVR
jgi:imidazolonepropionase-like amidohydrolase